MMAVRWIALAIGLASLVIVGIFLSAVLRPPAPVAGTNGGTTAPVSAAKRVDGTTGSWTLSAEVIPSTTGVVAVTVSVADVAGRPIAPPAEPQADLRMTGMAMGTASVPLVQDGPGSWRGSGRLAMGGRWSLRVNVGGEFIDVPFETTLR
jgi:hypothetical protein